MADDERLTLVRMLDEYVLDARPVDPAVSAERESYRRMAIELAARLNRDPGVSDLVVSDDDRLVIVAALSSRILGMRDAAWRAESRGDTKLGVAWRTYAGKIEGLMVRLMVMSETPSIEGITEGDPSEVEPEPEEEQVAGATGFRDVLHQHIPG